MKPKAQTLQQKMGFFDEDLKKPKHDEIMIWINENITKILSTIVTESYTDEILQAFKSECIERITKYEQYFNEIIKSCNQNIEDLINPNRTGRRLNPEEAKKDKKDKENRIKELEGKIDRLRKFEVFKPDFKIPEITRVVKTWELPITTGHNMTVGFIDFVATFNYPVLKLKGIKTYYNESKAKYEFCDIEDNFRVDFEPEERTYFFEIKTSIDSIGELIRQINHYKTYKKGRYFVVCPDDRSKEILKQQNIDFIKCPANF